MPAAAGSPRSSIAAGATIAARAMLAFGSPAAPAARAGALAHGELVCSSGAAGAAR
jgi:hypothetical protein